MSEITKERALQAVASYQQVVLACGMALQLANAEFSLHGAKVEAALGMSHEQLARELLPVVGALLSNISALAAVLENATKAAAIAMPPGGTDEWDLGDIPG